MGKGHTVAGRRKRGAVEVDRRYGGRMLREDQCLYAGRALAVHEDHSASVAMIVMTRK